MNIWSYVLTIWSCVRVPVLLVVSMTTQVKSLSVSHCTALSRLEFFLFVTFFLFIPPLIIFKETYLWIYIKGQTVSQKVRHTWQSSGMVPCEFAYVIWGYVTWHPVINNLQSTSGCQLIGHHWRSSAEVLMIWCTAYYSRHTNHQFSLITPSVRTSLILKLFYHHFVKANSRLSTNKKTFVN